MDVILLPAALLLCCYSQICHADLLRPRIDERIILYDNNNNIQTVRSEYRALTKEEEDHDVSSSFIGETIQSMSLSFDVSESVKSLNLGDKSLAVGE